MIREKIRKSDLLDLKQRIENKQEKILILSHRNPDGDAIGSSLALMNVLRNAGNTVNVLVPNDFPEFLKWMKLANEIVLYSKKTTLAEKLLKEATLIIVLDFNDLNRVREFQVSVSKSQAYKLLIDHHPLPDNFANLTLSFTEASSTAELVYEFVLAMGLSQYLDSDAAECIYAGILTDTGCFSYNSSQPQTYRVIAELLALNINKDKVYSNIFDNFSHQRMQLLGYCLDKKMRYLPEYRTAYLSLTQEEMRSYNFRVGDSEGFVNMPLSIKGVIFSALFTETKDIVKISLRSKGSFPVNKICAEHFKGGGHCNAAGGESSESLDKTIEKFINLLPLYQNELLQS